MLNNQVYGQEQTNQQQPLVGGNYNGSNDAETYGELQETPQTFPNEMFNYNHQFAAPPYQAPNGAMTTFYQSDSHCYIVDQHHHLEQQQDFVGADYGQMMTPSNFHPEGVTFHQQNTQQHLVHYGPAAVPTATTAMAFNEQHQPMKGQHHAPQTAIQQLYCHPMTMASDRHHQPQHYYQRVGFADQRAFNGFSAGNFPAPRQMIGEHAQFRRQTDVSTLDYVPNQNNSVPTTTTDLGQRVHYGHEQTHSLSADNNTATLYQMPPPPSTVDASNMTAGSMQTFYSTTTLTTNACGFVTENNPNHIDQTASSTDSLPNDSDKEQVTEVERGVFPNGAGLGQDFRYQSPADAHPLNETTNCESIAPNDTRQADLTPSPINHCLAQRQAARAANQQDYIDMRSSGDISQEWLDTICRHMIEHMDSFGICVIDNFLGSLKGEMILKEVKQLFSNRNSTTGRLVSDKIDTSSSDRQTSLDPTKTIRNDRVIWVDGCEEGCEEINNLIQTLCSVITNSSRLSLYSNNGLDKVVITKRTKAHVACYPGNGTKYIKHVDNPNGDGRVITAIYYLNKSWSIKRDGGLLRMFPAGVDTVANIEPLFDRVLFFWSDRRNPHEVLPAYRDRFAITVWYIGDNRAQES